MRAPAVLLALLLLLPAWPALGDDEKKPEEPPKPETDAAVARRIESTKVTIDLMKPHPWGEVVEAVRREGRLNVHVSLRAGAGAADKRITVSQSDALLKDVLDDLAAKIDCTWEVRYGLVWFLRKARKGEEEDRILDRVDLSYLEWDMRKPLVATAFTLTWSSKALGEALDELTRRTGVPIKIAEGTDLQEATVSLRVGNVGAETVLQLLAEQVDGEIVAEAKSIVLRHRGAKD